MTVDTNFEFSVIPNEDGIQSVMAPQMTVFYAPDYVINVRIYLMVNRAMQITDGIAKTAIGQTKLWYVAHSPSGAMTASIKLVRLQFTFPNMQGAVPDFMFIGQRE